MLEAIHVTRNEVYITNTVKCRPPKNRNPHVDELQACRSYLDRQIQQIQPRIICTLGLPATQIILGKKGTMGKFRGKVQNIVFGSLRCFVFPMYHPAYLLRAESKKLIAWKDLQKLEELYRIKESDDD